MAFEKEYKDKEFVCRQCMKFLDIDQLIDCKCPSCGTDEYVFMNDLKIDE